MATFSNFYKVTREREKNSPFLKLFLTWYIYNKTYYNKIIIKVKNLKIPHLGFKLEILFQTIKTHTYFEYFDMLIKRLNDILLSWYSLQIR